MPYERRQNLAVIDLQKNAKNLLSNFKDKQALGPFWASDNRVLFFVDDDGKEEYQIYAVDPDGSDPTNLGYANVAFLRRLHDDPKHILVQAYVRQKESWEVGKLDLSNGKITSIVAHAPPQAPVSSFVIDHANQVRFAIAHDDGAKLTKILYRDKNGQEWQEVASFPYDAAGWSPIEFDGDNRTVFVASNLGRKTRAIYRFDTVTKQLGELVFGDDTYDVDTVIYDEFKQKVVGIEYEADRRRFHWLDEEMQQIHLRLEQALPDTVHQPVQFAEDGSKIIFYSYSDRDPGVYYVYDRKHQKVSELAVIKPKIDPAQMAPMKPVSYAARDGLTIHGYLTVPVGRDPKNLPLIIHPHGGPYGPRDVWGYDPEVQFYANRGFAVLQVNYRGSGGYGPGFESAGYKKWGLEMQDDLTDGVKWAVAQGLADPKRVVISGASYGGYATMAGLVYTPELYCAGINYVGVVDIANLIPKTIPARKMHWTYTRLGDLGRSEDRKRIHDTSPVYFADRIQAPLLMAYGKNDPRVPRAQADDIASAMKKADKPYELMIVGDEGHGFHKEENSIAFYTRVDVFLKKFVLNQPAVVDASPAQQNPQPAKTD
ncbi:MAG TPA: S9 family peptidase [Candidatus Didemnitutus sp.]|nr:S9 family peptidase [Candidatus Didemnitutus sp.]